MKKLFVPCLVAALSLFFVNTSDAQTSRGSFMVGGELGFSSATSSTTVGVNGQSTESEPANASQFNIAPSLGYFFADNLAIGLGIDYTLNTIREEDENRLDSDLLFGPFVRYYVPFGGDKALFFEVDFGYGNSANSFTEVENGQNVETNALTNVFAVGVGPGFTIFSNDAIGIEALAKYNFANANTTLTANGAEVASSSITHAFDFSVGIQVYFTRVKPAQ